MVTIYFFVSAICNKQWVPFKHHLQLINYVEATKIRNTLKTFLSLLENAIAELNAVCALYTNDIKRWTDVVNDYICTFSN